MVEFYWAVRHHLNLTASAISRSMTTSDGIATSFVNIEVSDWWAPADLRMFSLGRGEEAVDLASGPLVEIIELAQSANRLERDRLFLTSSALNRKLAPSQIRKLAERDDFPMVI